jgi:hypothetical protein
MGLYAKKDTDRLGAEWCGVVSDPNAKPDDAYVAARNNGISHHRVLTGSHGGHAESVALCTTCSTHLLY